MLHFCSGAHQRLKKDLALVFLIALGGDGGLNHAQEHFQFSMRQYRVLISCSVKGLTKHRIGPADGPTQSLFFLEVKSPVRDGYCAIYSHMKQ
jgi:hypothetical protein